jgi:hypothetical protein
VGTSCFSQVGKSSISEQSIVSCFQIVSTNAEQIRNLTVDGEELLSLHD